MKRITLLFIPFLFQSGVRLGDTCGLNTADSVQVVNWNVSWEFRTLSQNELKTLFDLSGEPIRILPDGDYIRFDTPTFTEFPIEYQVTLSNGDVQYLLAWERDSALYIFGFNDLEVTTDLLGQHEGAHHICTMLRVDV